MRLNWKWNKKYVCGGRIPPNEYGGGPGPVMGQQPDLKDDHTHNIINGNFLSEQTKNTLITFTVLFCISICNHLLAQSQIWPLFVTSLRTWWKVLQCYGCFSSCYYITYVTKHHFSDLHCRLTRRESTRWAHGWTLSKDLLTIFLENVANANDPW